MLRVTHSITDVLIDQHTHPPTTQVVLHADELMAEIMREPLRKDDKDFYKLKDWYGNVPSTETDEGKRQRKKLLRHFRFLKLFMTVAIAVGMYCYAWFVWPDPTCPP